MEHSQASAAATISEEEVIRFLEQNPNFLERHPQLLDTLEIPHASGNAVSLVEKQVSILRERNIDMRQRLGVLTDNARRNDRLYEHTRKLALALLEANDLRSLQRAYMEAMAGDFKVEYAAVIMFGNEDNSTEGCRVDSLERARNEVGALLRSRKPLCGALRLDELNYLFPGVKSIGSAAIMPILSEYSELGLIAVGSSDPHRYDSQMDTLFLGHIADVMARLIPRLQQERD